MKSCTDDVKQESFYEAVMLAKYNDKYNIPEFRNTKKATSFN